MKRGAIICLLLGILLVSPLIQAQTYSNFNRFTDNVRLFFSGGDDKVRLALEIREKEVNSAIENVQALNNEHADKNLQKAWKKLQLIQEKVSIKTALEVKENSREVRENILEKENLTENFEVYVLEEEKTELTAEWVIEVTGEEGQTLEQEVEIVVETSQGRITKIENRIVEIDNEIANWVVRNEMGEDVAGGLAVVVKTEIAKGDNGLKPEVKTSVITSETQKNNIAEGDGGEGDYAEGTTAEGVGAGDSGSEEAGTEGNNEIASAVESNGGNFAITGEVINSESEKSIDKESWFNKFLKIFKL